MSATRPRRAAPTAAHQEFSSTNAKDEIRHDLDRKAIAKFRDQQFPDGKLTYFGLPGEEMLDILAWREFLGACTVVEAHEENAERLELTVLKNHLEGSVRLIIGSIDDIIPSDSMGDKLTWPFQVVNLDYVGGLVNVRDDNTSHRIEALKKLFVRQEGAAFVLLLTLNTRDDDQGEMDSLVQSVEEDLMAVGVPGVRESLDAHRALGHVGLLKIYVPIILENEVRTHSLEFLPPVHYQGTRPMMHFVVTCVPYSGASGGRTSKITDRIDLINLPLHTLHGGSLLKEHALPRIGVPAD